MPFGDLGLKGYWDAANNRPELTSGRGFKGWVYKVLVAGNTNLDGITDWNIGDLVYFDFDGGAWSKITGSASGAGTGDVVGPASSIDGNVAVFDGVTGKDIKDGGTLAAVALSGQYNDLLGLPPAAATPYVHTQPTSAALWVVNHNLNALPIITATTPGGVEVVAEVLHTSLNQAQLTFVAPQTGQARCI
jgi:hypothetical protein